MSRIVRFGVFGLLAAVLVCVAVFTLGRPAGRRVQPTAAAIVETDPTAPPPPAAPTRVPRGYIGQDTIGDAWPLTIPSGTIVCDRNAILLRAPDDRLYAVNGTAIGQVTAKGWRDVHELAIDTGNGTIKSLQPLLDLGLQLCPQR